MMGSLAGFSQSFVSTGAQKYVLLEEGTGTWCGYCPDGSQRLQQTVEPAVPHFITVAFHNGDPLALPGDPFNGTFIHGFPGGAIDRLKWNHGGTIQANDSVNDNRGYWLSDVQGVAAQSPNFQVDMTSSYNATTRVITITVTGKALAAVTGSYAINAYITEDSISGATYPQHSYMYSGPTSSWFYNQCLSACPSYTCAQCAVLPAAVYAHMNVVRAVLASGGSIYGDVAFTNPTVGNTQSKTYTYTIPAGSPMKFVKVVGLVQKKGTDYKDNAIQNAIAAKVSLMSPTGVNNTANMMNELELYPNPAQNYIHVTGSLSAPAETKIVITNAAGQMISEKIFPVGGTMFSENIQVGELSNGVYFMTVVNGTEKITKRFTIEK